MPACKLSALICEDSRLSWLRPPTQRGGVARIYRLLAEERARQGVPLPGSTEALQQELQDLRAKLSQSESREDAHQTRWAEEVDRLRLKVAQLEPLARQYRVTHESHEYLRHQLQVAIRRATLLEDQVRQLTQVE